LVDFAMAVSPLQQTFKTKVTLSVERRNSQ
jgi:hypothetical protein